MATPRDRRIAALEDRLQMLEHRVTLLENAVANLVKAFTDHVNETAPRRRGKKREG